MKMVLLVTWLRYISVCNPTFLYYKVQIADNYWYFYLINTNIKIVSLYLQILKSGKYVSFDRGITIHQGNFPMNTTGCLLPGSNWRSNFVSGSRRTRDLINTFIRNTCYKKVKFNIFEEF